MTSGTRALLTGWLDVMKMPEPEEVVVAEDVSAGKPAPDCYLLGMERLGLGDPGKVLVVEDSTSGILAGKAAGCKVLAVVTTHRVEQLLDAGADWVVQDLTHLHVADQSRAAADLAMMAPVLLRISHALSPA